MKDSFRWKELPQDIQEKVLARLLSDALVDFAVCKKWNNLLSSTRFVTTLWAQTPANRNPWLVALCWLNVVEFCPSYNFTTKTWEKPFSFSFLQEKAAAIGGGFRVGLCYMSSGAGLCIVDLMPVSLRIETLPREENFLCNPITRTFLKLPNIPSRKSIGIMEGEGNSYKIVAISESRDGGHMRVSIYDPSQKIWTMVGQLPNNLKVAEGRMVASKSSVYCLVCMESYGYAIVGFNIGDGTSNIIPLPKLIEDSNPQLFTCRGRLLLVGYVHIDGQVEVHDEHEFQEQFLIWELQENMASSSNSSPSSCSCWKEIAKMPSSVCKKLSGNMITNWLYCLKCVGAGDYVVFSLVSRNEIFYYDLTQQLWGSFRLQSASNRAGLFAFEPRPDVKVE